MTGLVFDPIHRNHVAGFGHPEQPARCEVITASLKSSPLRDHLLNIKAREATDEEIAACHDAAYIQTVKREVESGLQCLSTGDTDICKGSLEAAHFAAGGVLAAVDAVVGGKVKNAFCNIRPPGHHATRNRGMGFCIFNNVAIGSRYAQKAHGLGKILIVDWDVHHGNGTQDIFYEDNTVLYFSMHLWPWYPGTGAAHETGADKGKGYTLNVPLGMGAGRVDVMRAMKEKLVPTAEKFKPEMIFISAGFDSRIGDPLGHFMLTDDDFHDMTLLLMNLAEKCAAGRVVSVLEGGYNLEGLASAAVAHVRALSGV